MPGVLSNNAQNPGAGHCTKTESLRVCVACVVRDLADFPFSFKEERLSLLRVNRSNRAFSANCSESSGKVDAAKLHKADLKLSKAKYQFFKSLLK